MILVLISASALSVAVIIRVFLDPWSRSDTRQPQKQSDEERAQMMEVIAQSFF